MFAADGNDVPTSKMVVAIEDEALAVVDGGRPATTILMSVHRPDHLIPSRITGDPVYVLGRFASTRTLKHARGPGVLAARATPPTPPLALGLYY
jgi:hypothetical protein